MANPESRLVTRILAALRSKYPGGYFRKIHGNAYQHAGIPDIVGCVAGRFIGLEVKTDNGRVSTIQVLEGEAIVAANGIHAVVRSPEEAIEAIESPTGLVSSN